VSGIVSDYKKGVSEEKCFGKIHNAYDEHDAHGWCHTLSNAMIVTAALLYGGGDYGKSICKSVQTGFDTDCNGATVGSVLGMRNGIGGVGAEWTKPVNGMLDTSVFGVGKVKILDMVEATMKHLPE
jgi:ADP-ribosylglycohydrolase